MDFKKLFDSFEKIESPNKKGAAVLEDDGLFHFSKICSELNIDLAGFRKSLYRMTDDEMEAYGVRKVNGKWAIQMEKFRKVADKVLKKFKNQDVLKFDPDISEDAFFNLKGRFFLASILKSRHMPVEDPPFRSFLRENKAYWKELGFSIGRKKYLIDLPIGFLALSGFQKREPIETILEKIEALKSQGVL